MELHSISSVALMADGAHLVVADLTDGNGDRATVKYVSRDGDEFGLAPVIREAVSDWVAAGNPVSEHVAVPSLGDFQYAIQAHVDAVAVAKLYNDGNALAGYVNSTVPQWASEAQTFVAWRDAVWVYAYAELDKVQNGGRPAPTVEAFVVELPEIEWPA